MGTVFGPLLGALVFLGLEEVLKGFTEHWMAVFGPLIVLMALVGKRGIVGLLQRLDRVRASNATRAPAVAAKEAA
jgi:branched-chain amino acid transport system permease protein